MAGPAAAWFGFLLLQAWARHRRFDPLVDRANCGSLSPCPKLWLNGAGGRAVFTVVVIGLGEELIFRGLLMVLALSAKLEQFSRSSASASPVGTSPMHSGMRPTSIEP